MLLARIQFAFTVSFHFIFPSFSIGLASYLAVLEGLWLWTGREVYLNLFKYWLKIFALAFAMGVVSGIVMSYQFGTNWSVFSDKAGPIIGPLMAYEVMTAFFLEAGFLGIMLFGMNRVGPRLHFAATLAVAVGTFISAFWILSANSLDADARRLRRERGRAVRAARTGGRSSSIRPSPIVWSTRCWPPTSPRPSSSAASAPGICCATATNEGARVMFSMATGMIAVVAPLQILAGDMHGLNTLEHQPAKVMAMEGHFESHPDGAPLILFGIPDQEAGTVRYAIEIPKASSLILKHDLECPAERARHGRPRRTGPTCRSCSGRSASWWAWASLMLGLGALSLGRAFRGRLYDWRPLHRLALAMGPAGFVAVIAGWVTTEVGRQPFTVYGLLRTAAVGLAARGPGRGRIAADLHRRLLHRVRRRHRLHPQAHGQAAASRARPGPRQAPTIPSAPPASPRRPSVDPGPHHRRGGHDHDDRFSIFRPSGPSSSRSRSSPTW